MRARGVDIDEISCSFPGIREFDRRDKFAVIGKDVRPGTFLGNRFCGGTAPGLTGREDACHFGRLSKETERAGP
jgi:hypothetical protein